MPMPDHSKRPLSMRLPRFASVSTSSRGFAFATSLGLLVVAAGCSKEELTQAYEDAKAKTQEVTQTTVAAVEERLPESGSISLRSDFPIEKFTMANIEIIAVGDGRPSSMQIYTYDPSSEYLTYPAMHIHGPTSLKDVSALTGESLPCDMYLRTNSNGPVAMTRPGESIMVTFGIYDAAEGTITANLSKVDLMTSDDQTLSINGGELIAVAKETSR